MSIRISSHVRQRLQERAGDLMSDEAILALIPELDRDRIARGEDVVVRVPRLKLDLIATERAIVSAVPSHRGNTVLRGARAGWTIDEEFDWRRSAPAGRPVARTRQACFDADEDLVVGGRVWRVEGGGWRRDAPEAGAESGAS